MWDSAGEAAHVLGGPIGKSPQGVLVLAHSQGVVVHGPGPEKPEKAE